MTVALSSVGKEGCDGVGRRGEQQLGGEVELGGAENGVAGIRVSVGDLLAVHGSGPRRTGAGVDALDACGIVFTQAHEDEWGKEADVAAGKVGGLDVELELGAADLDPERVVGLAVACEHNGDVDVGCDLGIDLYGLPNGKLASGMDVLGGVGSVKLLRLADDDVHMLAKEGCSLSDVDAVGRDDLALCDLDQRGSVAEGVEISGVDDLYVLVAAEGRLVVPLDEIQLLGGGLPCGGVGVGVDGWVGPLSAGVEKTAESGEKESAGLDGNGRPLSARADGAGDVVTERTSSQDDDLGAVVGIERRAPG